MDSEVLTLLLTARYVGAPAFNALGKDIDTLVGKTSGLAKTGAAINAMGVALTAAGIAGASVIVAAVKQAAQYQQSLQRLVAIHAVLPGQMAAIDAAISHTSDTYGQSAKDWADASYFIASAMAAQNEAVSAGAKNLAIYTKAQQDMAAYVAASGQGLPGSITPVQAASDIPRQAAAWGMKPQQWAMVEAWNTAIERRQNITPAQLLQMTPNAAPGATEAGVSMPQLLAIEGALSTSGDYKARGGTEMKSGLSHLFSKSGQAGARALGLNISHFYKHGEFDLISFIAAAQAKTAGMSPVQRTNAMNALFGQVGNRAFGLLAQPGALAMARANLAAESNNPVAQMYQQAADQMHSPLAQLKSIWSSLNDVLRMIGGALLTKLYPALQTVSHFLLNLASKLHQNPALAGKLATGLVSSTAAALGGGPLLSIAGKALMNYGLSHPKVGMADFIGKAAGHVWGFGKALSPYPLLAKAGHAGAHLFRRLDTTANPFAWLMEKGLPAVGHGIAKAPGAVLAGVKGLPRAALGGLKGIGGSIFDFIKGIGPAIAGAIPAIAGFGSALLPIVAVVLLVAGAVTALVLIFTRYRKEAMQVGHAILNGLTPVFKLFMGIVTSTLGMISKAWNDHKKQVDTAMKGLLQAFKSALPFFQVVGTVIAVILGVVIRVIGYVVSAFLDALPHIIDFFANVFRMLGDLGRIIMDVIHGKWGQAWKDAQALLGHAWDAIKSLLGVLWSFITGIFGRLWADIGPAVQRVGSGLRDFFGGLWGHISGAVGGFLGGVIGFFTSIPGKIVGALSGLANALKGVFRMALNAAISALPAPMQQLTKHLLHIGGNASGGYIPHAQLTWVGEKGKELVALPGGSRVFSHFDSMNMVNTALRPVGGGGFHSGMNGMNHIGMLSDELRGLSGAVAALAKAHGQRTPAEEYLFARNVQAQRESVWNRFPNTSREFDSTYRRAYQYFG